MCDKRNAVRTELWDATGCLKDVRLDKCIAELVAALNHEAATAACCCGHNKYPMTIVAKRKDGTYFEMISGVDIPRKRRFYKRDDKGYFYIPEVVER